MTKLVLLSCILSISTSCGDTVRPPDEPETVDLVVRVALASSTIATIVVEVTAPDITTPLAFNLTIVSGVASGSISLPTGTDRTITIRAYDAAGIETHRGSVTISVTVGDNATVTVTIEPLVGGVPLVVTIGSFAVTVAPDTVALNVGETATLVATVVNGAGDTIDAPVTWATLRPAIVTVDTAGIVTAHASGSAQIVAAYGGVGGSAHILVAGDTATGATRFTDEAAFVAATSADTAVQWLTDHPLTASPIQGGPVQLASAAGFNARVEDFTPVLPGREYGVSGAENINGVLALPVSALGLWVQDHLAVGDGGGCPGRDSRFLFTFKNGDVVVAQFEEDPPVDTAYFVGFAFASAVDHFEIREIGSVVDDLNDQYCENDFIGRILLAPAMAWHALPPLPDSVGAAVATTLGGRIYVLGGGPAGVLTTLNQVYNPETNSWTNGAAFTGARAFAMAGGMSDGVHLLGGVSNEMDHQVYSPADTSWSAAAPLLVGVRAGVAEVIEGKLYVIGGISSDSGLVGTVQIYDLSGNAWSKGVPMPTHRLSAVSGVIGGRIYVAGGEEAGITTSTAFEAYEPTSNTWSTLPDLPTTRESMGGGVIEGMFCVFGGRLSAGSPTGDAFPQTYCYEPGATAWIARPDMLTPRVNIASVELGNAVYALGGRTGPDNVATAEVLRRQ